MMDDLLEAKIVVKGGLTTPRERPIVVIKTRDGAEWHFWLEAGQPRIEKAV